MKGRLGLEARFSARFSVVVQGGEPTMTLAVRFLCTFAIGFLMVPRLHAGGAGEQSQAGSNAGPVGAIHRWYDSENDTPKVEWYLGYSFWRAMPTSSSNRMGYLQGGSTSVAYNLNSYFGLAADFGGYDDNRLTFFGPTGSRTVDSNGSANTYAVGPRFGIAGMRGLLHLSKHCSGEYMPALSRSPDAPEPQVACRLVPRMLSPRSRGLVST